MEKVYQELCEKLAKNEKPRKRFFNFLDSCFSLFVVSPLVVSFWKGIWCIINEYHAMYGIFPVWKFLVICYIINTTIYFSRDKLSEFILGGEVKTLEDTARRFWIYRLYHYVFAFCSIMIWRCIWEIPVEVLGTPLGELLRVVKNSTKLF